MAVGLGVRKKILLVDDTAEVLELSAALVAYLNWCEGK